MTNRPLDEGPLSARVYAVARVWRHTLVVVSRRKRKRRTNRRAKVAIKQPFSSPISSKLGNHVHGKSSDAIPTVRDATSCDVSSAFYKSVSQEKISKPGVRTHASDERHVWNNPKVSFGLKVAGIELAALALLVAIVVPIVVSHKESQEAGPNPVVAQEWMHLDSTAHRWPTPSIDNMTVYEYVLVVNEGRSPVEIADVYPRMPVYTFATATGCNSQPFTVEPNASQPVVVQIPGNTAGTVMLTQADGTKIEPKNMGQYPGNAAQNYQKLFQQIKENCFSA